MRGNKKRNQHQSMKLAVMHHLRFKQWTNCHQQNQRSNALPLALFKRALVFRMLKDYYLSSVKQ
eukprot:14914784-Ditylum_brightwellii.AAC.1